jgi:hypothetical protein
MNYREGEMNNDTYGSFLRKKAHQGTLSGFKPTYMPDMLFDFQKDLVDWSVQKGRAAIFADCGTGKTFLQLAWAENIVRHTSGRVLILTPLAVSFQTVKEAEKLGVEVSLCRDQMQSKDRIVITNYERLQHFDPNDFQGVVCDESSILKNFNGKMRQHINDFMRKRLYRLLCTATAAPNDFIELGTSSEALGEMGNADMLSRFFKRDKNFARIGHRGGQGWQMRSYAEQEFWRWVCSWARALRKPSDMGYDDKGYDLPPIHKHLHVVSAKRPRDGYLFDIPAVGLQEQRKDLRRTIDERCGKASDLIKKHKGPAIAWCNLNDESRLFSRNIQDSVEVQGSDSVEHKEGAFSDFVNGNIRVLITKPSIGGFGLNFQHCAHLTLFPSHSYEQYYQVVRRCWRFGQKNPVTVDMITTDGQENVLKNLERKAIASDHMFSRLVEMMWKGVNVEKTDTYTRKVRVPSWLKNKR